MTETRIEGKFYPLQVSEWVDVCRSLTKSQISVLYYLRSNDPYSNGVRVKASQVAKEIGITKRAVNSAIAVLEEKGYINLEDVEYSVKVNPGGCLCDSSDGVTQVGNSVPTREENFPPEKSCSHSGNSVPTREENFPSEKRISHSSAGTQSGQELHISKTLKKFKNIKDTTDRGGSVKKVFEENEERLRIYGVYLKIWDGEKVVPNEKMISLQKKVARVPREKIERGIRAFCSWAKEAKGINDKYKALESSILRGWEG